MSHPVVKMMVSVASALVAISRETSDAMLLSVDHVFAIEEVIAGFTRDGSLPLPPADGTAPVEPLIELRLHGDDLHVKPIEGGVSAGWVAVQLDPACDAVGLCLPAGGDLYLGAVVDRVGASDTFVVDDGLLVFERLPATSLIEDLSRRRLGLATAAPDIGTDWHWLIRWLVDVAAGTCLVLDPHGTTLDVVTVAGMHPAVEREELVGLDRSGIASFVVERHRQHARSADWECVRLDALIDDGHPAHCWARHLDEGAFSRWITSQGVPLSALAQHLIGGCSPFALELIGAVVSDIVVRHEVR